MTSIRRSPRKPAISLALAALAVLAAGCGNDDRAASGGSDDDAMICVDFPRSDTDFWNAFIDYIPKYADEQGLNIQTTNSENDVQKLVENIDTCVAQGARAIVMAPQDTAAIAPTLERLASEDIPVVTLDTRPDEGAVAMVVRADNVALGTQACEYLGEQMGGEGTAVQLMGGQDSINGRDRATGFEECMSENFPNIKVISQPSEWDGDKAASQLQTVLQQDPNVRGVYMASSFALAGTQQVLARNDLDVPADDPKHVFVVSNDGIPQEYADIRDGKLDATVSQPADLYAKYGLLYAKAAIDGETFESGATDHDSTIVEVRDGVLEDQLPSVLVTSENVDDDSLWGNNLD